MKNTSHKKLIISIIVVLIVALLGGYAAYKQSKIKLLDKSAYKSLYKTIKDDAENGVFSSQKDLREYITAWADEHEIKYSLDSNKNIIFTQEASARKKKVPPTVIVVNYNYENAYDNARVLASAAMIAQTDLESSKKTVIFVNNKDNDQTAYESLDASIFPSNAKVIYLDYSKAAYVSRDSFARIEQEISIPSQIEECTGDTMIKIRIGGLLSDCIDTNISNHPNPINNLETVLTRLKTKSIKYHINKLKVKGSGEMYPTEVELNIIINSYSKESLIKYLDKRVEAFEKANLDDYPNAYYRYEVIDDETKFEKMAYSDDASDALATLLYTIKNGAYRFEDDAVLPEGFEPNDIYGINCVKKIIADENGYNVLVSTQAIDDDYINMIAKDNKTAAALTNCNYEKTISYPLYHNKRDGLINTLKQTYFTVSDLSSSNTVMLKEDHDKYFTPMTYLKNINSKLDIVHVRENKATATVMTNMILCYINTKGNFMSL